MLLLSLSLLSSLSLLPYYHYHDIHNIYIDYQPSRLLGPRSARRPWQMGLAKGQGFQGLSTFWEILRISSLRLLLISSFYILSPHSTLHKPAHVVRFGGLLMRVWKGGRTWLTDPRKFHTSQSHIQPLRERVLEEACKVSKISLY